MTHEPFVDAIARRRIATDLESTFVVEAAAGTGKTTALVQRVVETVGSGRGRLASLVGVTFTEKAAGEMKLRIRTELDRALRQDHGDSARAGRISAAIAELEVAKVATIHGFCAELLREHPVEAGVDPRFVVADAQHSASVLERAFDVWFERTIDDPSEGVRRVLRRRGLDSKGEPPRSQLLRAAARLVDTRDFDAPFERPAFDRAAQIDGAIAELVTLASYAERAYSASDPLRRACARLGAELGRANELDHDGREALLRGLARNRDLFPSQTGRGTEFGRGVLRAEVLEAQARARSALERCTELCAADLAACLSRELRAVVTAYEAEKARDGVIDFFDLLLLSRALLTEHPDVRARLQQTITHVFVDEFQDTDPVQVDILLLLCATDAREADPAAVRPVPGKLFLVGDPKQSIYRFRRADVSLYERVKAHLCTVGAEVLHLTTSFRSLPALQSFINAAFGEAMSAGAGPAQAEYVPLSPFRAARADQPAIIALPAPRPFGRAKRPAKYAIDAHLPDAVGAFVHWLIHDSGYHVLEDGADVALKPNHICLLFRRFRNYDGDVTASYVRALETRGIPHVLSGGRSFHTREEVVAVRTILTAIEWPDDALAVYATLRGPFCGCTDASLFGFKQRVGHLHPLGPVESDGLTPEGVEIATVLARLGTLHRTRNRRPIAHTLSEFLATMRAHAGIATWPNGEQALGNVLHVLEFARTYEARGAATSFRGFVEWLDEHAVSATSTDASVLEESSDGVRIMTIHAAKGLEFPVVILCEPTAPRRVEHGSRFVDPTRKLWAQSLCDADPLELIAQRDHVRAHDDAELVRLAYVATTRARELLVVPNCSESPIDGWLAVLDRALYPEEQAARAPESRGPGCPRFGPDAVVDRADHIPDTSVMPGQHRPRAGDHRVVWWDPNLLYLDAPQLAGVSDQELLVADEHGKAEEDGLAEYRLWQQRRDAALEAGARPSLDARTMTGEALQRAVIASTNDESLTSVATDAIEVLDTGADRSTRPRGPRFGTLVHALLATALGPDRDLDLAAVAHYLGDTFDASPDEVTHAITAVRHARSHPLFSRLEQAATRGQLLVETPVVLRNDDGVLIDGVIDLAFSEQSVSGETCWTVVDFKTDAGLGELAAYTAQLLLYADAFRRTFGTNVRCILLRV